MPLFGTCHGEISWRFITARWCGKVFQDGFSVYPGRDPGMLRDANHIKKRGDQAVDV